MPNLFDPITIGSLTSPNRIAMPPMDLQQATEKGEVTDKLVEHYRKRARGLGMVIVEHSYVLRGGNVDFKQLGIYDDSQIPGLKRVSEVIKNAGAVAVIQISHAGRQAPPKVTGIEPVSASALTSPGDPDMPHELSVEEIDIFIDAYAEAAGRAREAGFDAVDLHGAHGYLINQFVSPYSNHRADEYGGSLENRMKFPLQIIERVQKVAGRDFPIFYRVSAAEFLTGGLTLAETSILAQRIADAGVQLIDVSGGIPASSFIGAGQFEGLPGYLVPLSAGIKRAVHVPTIAVGRITSPLMAADIVAGGQGDFAAIGRELLRVPDWGLKAKEMLRGVEAVGDRFRNYRREMEHALMSVDTGMLRGFCGKWAKVYDDHVLEKDAQMPEDKLEVLMHKSISVSLVLDPDTIEESRQWLIERGYGTMPD